MTYEPWKDGSFLIRFEHLLEKNEDPELSKPIKFNLIDVFPGYEIELKEVILSANQWIEQLQRLHFNSESGEFFNDASKDSDYIKPITDNEITLDPMEIRTFVMTKYPKV
jgi:lysosomal alpha-mannosidase